MNVRVQISFRNATEECWKQMNCMAAQLTDDPGSVRIVAGDDPTLLVATFSMRKQNQLAAVGKIDGVIRFGVPAREDSTIWFLKTPEERERANRKLAQAKARRRARREATG